MRKASFRSLSVEEQFRFVSILADLGVKEADQLARTLLPLCRAPGVRDACSRAIATTGGSDSVEVLAEAIAHGSTNDRISAMRALSQIRDHRVPEILAQVYRSAKSGELRSFALEFVAGCVVYGANPKARPFAVRLVLEGLRHRSPEVRCIAIWQAKALGLRAAIPALRKLVTSKAKTLRLTRYLAMRRERPSIPLTMCGAYPLDASGKASVVRLPRHGAHRAAVQSFSLSARKSATVLK